MNYRDAISRLRGYCREVLEPPASIVALEELVVAAAIALALQHRRDDKRPRVSGMKPSKKPSAKTAPKDGHTITARPTYDIRE